MHKGIDVNKKNIFCPPGGAAKGGNTNIVNQGTINIFQGGPQPGQILRQTGKPGLGNSKNASDLNNIWASRPEPINHTNFRQGNDASIFSGQGRNEQYDGYGFYGQDEHGGIGQRGVHDRDHCQMEHNAQKNEQSYQATSNKLQKSTNQPTIAYGTPVQQQQKQEEPKKSCSGGGGSCGSAQPKSSGNSTLGTIFSGLTGLAGMAIAGFGIYKMFSSDSGKKSSGSGAKGGGEAAGAAAPEAGAAGQSKSADTSSANAAAQGADSSVKATNDSIGNYREAKNSNDVHGMKQADRQLTRSKSELKDQAEKVDGALDNTNDNISDYDQIIAQDQDKIDSLDAQIANAEAAETKAGTDSEKAAAVESDCKDKFTEVSGKRSAKEKEIMDTLSPAQEKAQTRKDKAVENTPKTKAAFEKSDAAYTETRNQYQEAQKTTQSAKSSYATAKTNLANAQSAYDSALASGGDPSSAQQALQQAIDAEANAKAKVTEAEQNEAALQAKCKELNTQRNNDKELYDAAVAEEKEAVPAFETADKALKQGQADLKELLAQEKTTQTRWTEAQKSVTMSKEQLAQAKANKAAYEKDQGVYKGYKDKAASEQGKLRESKASLGIARDRVSATMADVDQTLKR